MSRNSGSEVRAYGTVNVRSEEKISKANKHLGLVEEKSALHYEILVRGLVSKYSLPSKLHEGTALSAWTP